MECGKVIYGLVLASIAILVAVFYKRIKFSKNWFGIVLVILLAVIILSFCTKGVVEGWTNSTPVWNEPIDSTMVSGSTIKQLSVKIDKGTSKVTEEGSDKGKTCKEVCADLSGCVGFVLDNSSNVCSFKSDVSKTTKTTSNKTLNTFSAYVTGG